MSKLPEQIDRHERTGIKRWYKKMAARIRRRFEKKDPENAPKRNRFHGYTG